MNDEMDLNSISVSEDMATIDTTDDATESVSEEMASDLYGSMERFKRPSAMEKKVDAKMDVKNDESFQQELVIDKYKLDEECLSHASRYAYWAEAASLAKAEANRLKDNVAYVEASRNIALRNMYAEAQEKITETRLAYIVDVDDELVEARRKFREAEEISYRMDVAVRAMEIKRAELDNLVKLYCAGYFSTVSGDPNVQDVTSNVETDMRANLNKED